MWREWWKSPQATRWHTQTSLLPLSRLAALYDRLLAGEDLKTAELTAMGQLENKFGLTPKGMKELNWVIGDVEAPAKPSGSNVTSIGKYRDMVGG